MENEPLYGQTGGQHFLGGLIDHSETYGSHIIKRMVSNLGSVDKVVDLGAGTGRDLMMVKQLYPSSRTIALEAGHEYVKNLQTKVDQVEVINIERDIFPFPAESVDLFMANQILEHTKEVFWIFDQITRSLSVGGHFIFGTPNICSLHNRLLMLCGSHPTQHKLCSAHVRPFSKKDTLRFLEAVFPRGYELVDFGGSQFYPFPGKISRILSTIFPEMAFSIFFKIKKIKHYHGEFLKYPSRAHFETNFWIGDSNETENNQYWS